MKKYNIKLISTVILPLPLIQEGQLPVSGGCMINRLEKLSLSRNSVVRLTDHRYMTEIVLQRRKTSTQTNKFTGTQLKMHVSKLRMYLNTMHRVVLKNTQGL